MIGGRRGPAAEPLHVLLIPADGGTESGTLADYQPIFNAVSRSTGMTFEPVSYTHLDVYKRQIRIRLSALTTGR